jgi:DNA-directed RNA polymerase subunit RPC12/RpoP
MVVISTNNYSPYGIACAQCNHRLIAPNWSEYVSERHVRHSWSCESCGHQFETSDYLRLKATSNTRRNARSLPSLVA